MCSICLCFNGHSACPTQLQVGSYYNPPCFWNEGSKMQIHVAGKFCCWSWNWGFSTIDHNTRMPLSGTVIFKQWLQTGSGVHKAKGRWGEESQIPQDPPFTQHQAHHVSGSGTPPSERKGVCVLIPESVCSPYILHNQCLPCQLLLPWTPLPDVHPNAPPTSICSRLSTLMSHAPNLR